ncbi:hypothetical protein BKG82_27605 [Mycobacteroides chelonae]|uniref:Uncharacterized protein n=1 Tax=Mycobacteroides chelonae TaxID=1774 RepID=A0A1S1LD92_MYCCH|nr:hypothetical protein [Mycobacteroides chelonae]OHU47378.1 hypothetical protein BKG82_27605 [Mycobacteroides chelonae]
MSVSEEYQRRIWKPSDISVEQTEHATSLRIPFLSSSSPEWAYITGIVVGESWVDKGVVPTETEVESIAKHLDDYCVRWYRDSFRNTMREFAPYDIDGAANLGYYMKRPGGGWCYRKKTWDHGPRWLPMPDESAATVEEVIDRNINRFAKDR